MVVTLILSFILMGAMFLMLWGAVGFVQDKRFFGSAAKDTREKVEVHSERFKGQHALGWVMLIASAALIVGVFVYGAIDGMRNNYGFWKFTLRFIAMLYLWKIFDIVVFDWFLCTKTRFFQHYYPETEGCSQYTFGYNRKEQIREIILYPFIAMAFALICILF